jgi:hypothetical protein
VTHEVERLFSERRLSSTTSRPLVPQSVHLLDRYRWEDPVKLCRIRSHSPEMMCGTNLG